MNIRPVSQKNSIMFILLFMENIHKIGNIFFFFAMPTFDIHHHH
jgi:hypothetical protein